MRAVISRRRQKRAYTRTLTLGCLYFLLMLTGSAGADNANLLPNASLEQGSGNTPSCWMLGGYGSNSYSWNRTTDTHSGSYAEALSVTSYNTGDRKLLTAFNGACSPAVTQGHSYTATVWYKSSSRPVIFAFSRSTSSSHYGWWAQSPRLPASSSWAQASWTTPVVPAGIASLSVGLGLQSAGSVTMDDFSLIDTTNSGGGTDTTPPTATISCNGSACSGGYYSSAVSVALAATDNVGGSGVSSIRFTTDGTTPTLTNGYTYSSPFYVGGTLTVEYRAYDNAGNASSVNAQPIMIDSIPPSVSLTAPSSGASLSGTVTLSAGASDNVAVDHVDFLVDGALVGSAPNAPYSFGWNSSGVSDGTHTVTARAVDEAGGAATTTPVSVTVANGDGGGGGSTYFTTLASGASGLPRGDANCASLVTTSTWEPRADNYTANHTVPSDPTAVPWSDSMAYWARFVAKRRLVTGNYTGTTNQIIQWAACKWGIDEDLLRAVAVQESDWHMSMVGDVCGPTGQASYGLFQIKNAYCNGGGAWGGYPYSAQDSALNADFYTMYLRSCLDGDFYDGGAWLYGGQTIAQIIAAHGLDYAVWGCVGSWYSGGWYDSGAQRYITSVQAWLAARTWTTY